MQLLDRIDAVARDEPQRIAYANRGGHTLPYRAASQFVRVARAAIRQYAAPGDTILLHFGNADLVSSILLGALSAGVHALPVHRSASPAEVESLAARIDAKLIGSGLDAWKFNVPIPVLAGNGFHGHGWNVRPHSTFGDLLLTSSGSTGVPKIIRRSAASLDAVSANMVEAIGFGTDDRVLAGVPLAHSYGLEHGLLAPLWAGATTVLADGLDLPHFERSFAEGIDIFPTVPAAIERLAEIDVVGLHNVRTIYSAGGPLPDPVRDHFLARHRVAIGQLYGATEIGTVCYRAGENGRGVGWPMHGVSMRSIDGEIAIRAPSMFSGYFDEPAPLVDGHFLTGDLGHVADDGSLVLTGRSKLLIDTGGPKVDPLEIERVLGAHPAVAECCVVALRQSETVARLRAIVVCRVGVERPTADSLRAFVRERLAPHKVPRVVEFRDALPRSAAGKIARHLLENE